MDYRKYQETNQVSDRKKRKCLDAICLNESNYQHLAQKEQKPNKEIRESWLQKLLVLMDCSFMLKLKDDWVIDFVFLESSEHKSTWNNSKYDDKGNLKW